MKLTSAEAAKLLRKLNEEYEAILNMEAQSKEFVASLNENIELIKPEYDFNKTQEELNILEEKIRKLKHAINMFNCQTIVIDFNMSIDQLLIYIPQLSRKKAKLLEMKNRLAIKREPSISRVGNIIDYNYANYDINEAIKEYERVDKLLTNAQTALDVINNTNTFEFEF